jgi:plastocyanin
MTAPAHGASLSFPFPSASPSTTTVNVAVLDSGFDPSTLAIPAGTTVVWTNKGATPHTVTAVDGSFASDDLGSGATYSYQFNQVGTFPYRDIHTTIMGTVAVVAGALQGASVPDATTTPNPPATASPPAAAAAAAGNRAGGPAMAFTGPGDWILGAVATISLVLGTGLLRQRPAVESFRVDDHTALVIERARRRREEFLPRRRRFLKR